MVAFASVAAGLVSLCQGARALTGEQIVQQLRTQLSPASEIVLTSDAAYAKDFTPRFSITNQPAYVVAVKASLVKDVQTIIRYASRNSVPFLATGGGHGYSSTLDRLRNGIALDLGLFNSVKVDKAANTMTIGGGVRSDEVATTLQKAGKEILTGNGDIVTASKDRHPDLFYALKGAGFNYGVATSLTYTVYPATNGGRAMNADMIFPGHLNGSVWHLAERIVGQQPKELSITFSVGYDASSGGMVIIANFIYAGPVAAGAKLIKPFLDMRPLNLSIAEIDWKDIPRKAIYGNTLAGCRPGISYVPYAVNLYKIDVPNLISVVNYMHDAMRADPAVQTAIIAWAQYAPYGFRRHTDASSAFPHRDALVFA
ncbi:hypothetical protein HIM_05421 [Hirsutella minnesotensis 3608]|uniref:FAD-binding PCMH-type domain-containing protein n=1 Tax=Hirsutella minnesotensis 3608 TaxID=1043627 RepID=A0A0F8A0C6_9HYPO|nr:hypothetical protein HIM_05421 [Hirsutella minnesotensis 3608]